MLIKLIANGADLDPRDEIGQTILHWASKNGKAKIVDEIVNVLKKRGNTTLINDKDFHGMTALHLAAGICNLDIVQTLLDNGADVNACNGFLTSVLHWAIIS